MYQKNAFCYILCVILKSATLRSEEIYSIMEDCQTKFFSKYWFPQDLSSIQISRNCKHSKLCFPHFLFDISNSVRQFFSKYWFPHDFSYFQISRNWKFQVTMFSTLFVWYTQLCQKKILSIGFHMTYHIFRYQGIENSKFCFPHFLFDITRLCQAKFFEVLVSTRLVIFSDFKESQIFLIMFYTLFVWYTEQCQTNIF